MKAKDIKQVMKTWYKEIENGDNSYNDLYNALYVLYSAGLIDNKLFDMIKEYDNKLFETTAL